MTIRPAFLRVLAAAPLMIGFALPALAQPRPPHFNDEVIQRRATAVSRPAPARPRSVSSLRSVPTSGRRVGPLANSFVPSNDSLYLVSANGFQDLDGSCHDRGWVGTDRSGRLFTRVQNTYTVNQAYMSGSRGPRFGTLTAPLATTGLFSGRGLTRSDSGYVIFGDPLYSSSPGHSLLEIYPSSGIIRVFGTTTDSTFFTGFSGLTLDRKTGDIIAYSIGGSSGKIYRFSSFGGSGVLIAGNDAGTTSDGPALGALLGTPSEIAVDTAGNVYFSESETHRVRVLRANGQIVTLAGNGTFGYSGDGGPALSAQLDSPFGVTVNPEGTGLYIIDQANTVVRRVDLASGIITTFLADPRLVIGDLLTDGSDLLIGTIASHDTDAGIWRLSGTVLTRLAGGGRFAKPSVPRPFGTELDLIDVRGLVSDNVGGFYFHARGQREILHLLSDGTIELTAGVPVAMSMGNRALRVGADMTTDPAEVSNWVQTSGYGNGWSQRVVSPSFALAAHPSAVLTFDAWLDLNHDNNPSSYFISDSVQAQDEFIVVQGLRGDGKWVNLKFRVLSQFLGATTGPYPSLYGRDMLKFQVLLNQDGNESVAFGSSTQLRIVVQSNTAGSSEDGVTPFTVAAAVLDNLALRDGPVDVLPPVDFESGSTGGWTLAALNGAYGPATRGVVRDIPLPATSIALSQNFDVSDSTCAWTFVSPDSLIDSGAYASLASPWVALAAGDTGLTIAFSGKLSTINEARLLNVVVRGKNVGDTHPRGASPANALLDAGTDGTDLDCPFFAEKTLRYPNDFQAARAYDSLQVVFIVEDRGDQYFSQPLGGRPPTRLPYLDDIHLYQVGVDQDFDGVANANDNCPATAAAGQDADGDGCLDPTSTMHHVESWSQGNLPLHFRLSQNGSPAITDGSDLTALRAAFQTWQTVLGANLATVEDPLTSQKRTSALDGINLITFEDANYPFSPSVLAVTPTLSFTRRAAYGDRIVLPGEIVDSDMLFNPAISFKTPTHPGDWDLRAVATHEAGHFFGLSHSGVRTSTMFFVQQPGQIAATLKNDDMAAISAAYPGALLQSSFATIKGSVTRDTSGLPIPGVLVTAVHLDNAGAPLDTAVSDYTREDGSFALYRVPPGRYGIHIQPLDGTVLEGLSADFISEHLKAIVQTNFDPEWYSVPEGVADDPAAKEPLTVSIHQVLTGIHIITNLDTIPPAVVSVTPADSTTGVAIDGVVAIAFSEAVDASTIAASLHVHPQSSSTRLAGSALLANHNRTLLFTPDVPLDFSKSYGVDLTTALTDQRRVHLAAPFSSVFTTQATPPVAITSVQPRTVPIGGLVTLYGQGFSSQDSIVVTFLSNDGNPDAIPTSKVSGTVVVQVPNALLTGADSVYITVYSNGTSHASNRLGLQIVFPPPQYIPTAAGASIPLGFTPSGVALSNDGSMAYVVGDGGFVTINLDPQQPSYRVPVSHLSQSSKRVRLTPDGTRAVISQPAGKDLLIVDAARTSGTFGTVLDSILVTGSPADLVIDPTGQRVYITEPALNKIDAADLRTSQPTAGQVIRSYPTANPFDGPIAIHPDGTHLMLGGSLGLFSLKLADSSQALLSSYPVGGPLAIDPTGVQAWAPAGGSGLSTAATNGGLVPALIPIGGQPRDVAMSPFGQSAFVVNGPLNLLQVVDITNAGGTFRSLVGQVGTGLGPVALAISGNGNLIAVANGSGRSVSLYNNTGGSGGPVLSGVIPSAAMPGDQIVATNGGSAATTFAGASLDLGLGLTPATRGLNAGASFVVPPSLQRGTSATVQLPDNTRSLSLPFLIVNPLANLTPQTTGRFFPLTPSPCSGPPETGPVDLMQVSPDGRFLAVHKIPNACPNNIDLFEISDNGQRGFGARDSMISVSNGNNLSNLAFSPDGKRIWAVLRTNELRILNSDPTSPQFTQTVAVFTNAGQCRGVVADPLGRRIIVTGTGARFYRPDLSLEKFIGTFTTAAAGAAITPDGHRMIVGGNGLAFFIDVDRESLMTTSPFHSGPGQNTVDKIAVTSDGKRAFGVFQDNTVSVWIMDPAVGTFGAETFHGTLGAVTPPIQSLTRGLDGHSVLVTDVNGAHLVRLDLNTTPPAALPVLLPQPALTIARSADGRRLFGAKWSGASAVADLQMYNLVIASQLSLVSGNRQTAAASAILPLPVDVRVTDALGNPQEGVVVRFNLGSAANGSIPGFTGSVVEKISDSNGEASVSWKLPAAGLTVALTVSALGTPTSPIALTANIAQNDNLIAPVVTEFGPPDHATGINTASPVFVKFNQKMDAASMNQHLTLFANGATVAGSLRLEDLGRTVIFQPSAPIAFSAPCSLVVTPGATDQEGQTLAARSSTHFTIQAPPGLVLTTLSPPAGPAGSAVTINGSGFSPTTSQNTVLFNGALGTVAANNFTSLVAGVPQAATSGPVTVQVASSISNALSFTVLAPNPAPGGALGDLPGSPGIRDIAITPDGTRLYVTNPTTNTVTALDVQTAALITNITVGSRPQAISIVPDGSRAYVANTGSNDVSVIDLNPQSPDYHKVIKTIGVGVSPLDLEISPLGPKVYVLNGGAGTLSVIDAQPGNATYDQVTTVVNTGSAAATTIKIAPDGTSAYVTTGAGFVVVNLKTNQVTTTVNLGSAATAITIRPDGTMAFAITASGQLVIVNLQPGPSQYQVTTTVNLGSAPTTVKISTDGTLAYVTSGDGNVVFVFEITASSSGASTILPTPKVTLTPVGTISVGQSPTTLVFDPTGKKLGYVVNSGSGTITRIGGLPPIPIQFSFNPNSLNLKSMGKWVSANLIPSTPYTPAQIVLSSVRLNGVVPVDSTGPHSADSTGLSVKFVRSQVELVVDAGDKVPVTATGEFTDGRLFTGTDSIKVKRGKVTAPVAGNVIAPHNSFVVRWDTPSGTQVQWVALLHSLDHGNNWVLDADHLSNTGSATWTVPSVNAESVKVAVVLVEDVLPSGVVDSTGAQAENVSGTLAVSDYFAILGPTDVANVPLALSFARIQPNPARGDARMRFALPVHADVRLEIFDVQGRRLRLLASGPRNPGWYDVHWNGRNEAGERVGAGLYFVRFQALGREFRQRLIWLH